MSFQESRDTLLVIPHLMRCSTSYRATTRYPGILSAALVLCGPSLGPASWCGVTSPSYRASTRYPEIPAVALDPCSLAGPRIVVRGDFPVIPRFDAVSRNTGSGT